MLKAYLTNTHHQHSIHTLVDTQSTSQFTVSQESTAFRSMHIRQSTIGTIDELFIFWILFSFSFTGLVQKENNNNKTDRQIDTYTVNITKFTTITLLTNYTALHYKDYIPYSNLKPAVDQVSFEC